MVDFTEIPLELQLREANHHIQSHLGKGQKYTQFLLPVFLQQFPDLVTGHLHSPLHSLMERFWITGMPTLPCGR